METGNKWTIEGFKKSLNIFVTFKHNKNKVYVMLYGNTCIDIIKNTDDHMAYLKTDRCKENVRNGLSDMQELIYNTQ